MVKVACKIMEINETSIGAGDNATPTYYCVYMLTEGTDNISGQIQFQRDTTEEQLRASLQVEAEKFARRDKWLDDLSTLVDTSFDFEFPDIGG
jgi:hypothetical protein